MNNNKNSRIIILRKMLIKVVIIVNIILLSLVIILEEGNNIIKSESLTLKEENGAEQTDIDCFAGAYENSTLPNGLKIVFIDFLGVLFPILESVKKEIELIKSSSYLTMLNYTRLKVNELLRKIDKYKNKIVILLEEKEYEKRKQSINYIFEQKYTDKIKSCEIKNGTGWEAYYVRDVILLPMSKTKINNILAQPPEQTKVRNGFFKWPNKQASCPTNETDNISDACLKYFTVVNFLNYYIINAKLKENIMAIKLNFVSQNNDQFGDFLQKASRATLYDAAAYSRNPFTIVLTKFELNKINKGDKTKIFAINAQLEYLLKVFDTNVFGQNGLYICDVAKNGYQNFGGTTTKAKQKPKTFFCDIKKYI